MRTCPFHLCGESIPDDLFSCRRHWFTLGRQDRARIREAYVDYVGGRIAIDELRRRQQEVLGGRGQVVHGGAS